MGHMLTRCYAMFTMYFGLLERVGNTLDNIVKVGEETSAAWVDQASFDRAITAEENELRRIQRRQKLLEATSKVTAAPELP